MNFKKRKIRKYFQEKERKEQKIPQNYFENFQLSNFPNWAIIPIGLIIIICLFILTFKFVKSLDFKSVIFSFGTNLQQDTKKQTNFLLVGVGGENHDGGNLTDTIIIASLNEKTNKVKMISIPRDLYIDSKELGGQRINKLYDTFYQKNKKDSSLAMKDFTKEISQIVGVPIQYYVKVDFQGFVKIIDTLGGVTIDVEKPIYDTQYPLGQTIQYTTFSLKAGIQDLDGETALKFARSRHSTSDFDRAYRQQQLLTAIKEKALDLNILTDSNKIQSLYNTIADSLETNLSITEIIQLAKISQDIDRKNIESRVFSDDFTSCGGFLYTPNREYFGGAAVLLPAGNDFKYIQNFITQYFYGNVDQFSDIQILNGTKVSGLAYSYLNRLSQECLEVVYYGNATNRNIETTNIYYNPIIDEQGNSHIPSDISIIQNIIKAPIKEGIPVEYLENEKRQNSKIVIELGADYKTITTTDPFDKLLYLTPISDGTADNNDLLNIQEENSSNQTDTSQKNINQKDDLSSNSNEKPITSTNSDSNIENSIPKQNIDINNKQSQPSTESVNINDSTSTSNTNLDSIEKNSN